MVYRKPDVVNLEVYALASGSSGNAMLVKSFGVNILIDAGLGIRKLSTILRGKGVLADSLTAILVTHEHIDHISGLGQLARRCGVPVIANRETLLACAEKDPLPFDMVELPVGESMEFSHLCVQSFPVPHDAVSPVGYVLTSGNTKIAYFTDAGSVNTEMREALRGANLAVVEANHDLEWLDRGPYTRDMKARVRSSTGHLSNDDCADLIADRLESDGPMTVWLAHLSRVNNSPSLARRSVEGRIQRSTKVPFSLDIALRDSPSASWTSGASARAVQLTLL